MKDKYIHDVCSCGCSVLTVPRSIGIDQLILRCLVNPRKQEYLKVTIKSEDGSLYGWRKVK
jgi:hypothetical protein